MSLFFVDSEKCNQDRHCVAECPGLLIQWNDRLNLPVAVDNAREMCIRCGHCVAVCPTGALSLDSMAAEMCDPVQPESLPSAEQTAHLLKSRRSIRSYRKKAIPQEELAELIDIARFAPSGHNFQPVRWQVESTPDRIKQLCESVVLWMEYMLSQQPELAQQMGMDRVVAAWSGGKDRILRGAPHVIIAHGAQADPSAQAASTIALTYLELAAASRGLGTCWAGYFNIAANYWEPMQQILGLPHDHVPYGSMMLGHPNYAYHRIPLRRPMEVAWR